MSEYSAAARGDLELRAPAEQAAVQNELLRRHLSYLAERSTFYQKRFADLGLDPERASLADLPVTTKDDLAASPDEFLCVDRSQVVDYALTSGTTGRPVAMLQTAADLDRVGFNEELSFRMVGVTAEDVVLIGAGLDRCFMAGLAYFLGLGRVGAAAIRGGSSSVPALAELVVDHLPTVIVAVPTLLVGLAARLAADGHDPTALGVERLVCIGEPVRGDDLAASPLGRRVAEAWGAEVFGTYASTEMATAFTECEAGAGGHVQPDLIVVEVLDEDWRPVTPGEPGEVVATPLGVTGMPLLRFATGDVARLHSGPCRCGRTTPRVGPIVGRRSQLLKVKGTTLYPPSVFGVLQEMPAVEAYYLEVYAEHHLSDRVRVVVGSRDPRLRAEEVAERIAARTRVKPEVVVGDPDEVRAHTLAPGKRKPVTFFDHRSP